MFLIIKKDYVDDPEYGEMTYSSAQHQHGLFKTDAEAREFIKNTLYKGETNVGYTTMEIK